MSNLLGKYSQVVIAVMAGAIWALPVARDSRAEVEPIQPAQTIANRPENGASTSYRTLHVNPEVGSDTASGLEAQPLRTVTRALEVAPPNTVIVLAPGRYSQRTGEVFPLQLKPGVTIQGAPGSSDRTAIIEGGGTFISNARSHQSVAIVAADRSGIAQVAVSNPDGYGVWVESGSPTILESAFVGNRQTGIYVVDGSPRIQGSYFSGNQVAGLIINGSSSASVRQNIFEGTGDAIRVLDRARPSIIGNRMTSNNAGLVVIGDASPTIEGNQIANNRQNSIVRVQQNSDTVAVAERDRTQPTRRSASEPNNEAVAQRELPAPGVAEVELNNLPTDELPNLGGLVPEEVSLAATADDSSLSVGRRPSRGMDSTINAASTPTPANDIPGQIPAGAPGSALQALREGIALGPRAVTGENPDSTDDIIRDRPSREQRREERLSAPEAVPAPPVNNNRLAVPNSSIPLGNGVNSSATIFSPPQSGAGAPPAPPSRAQALGLYYRVFVMTSDPFEQDEVREVVPDAFRSRFDGRSVMQVGAFPTEEEAEDRRELLEDNGFNVRVEYIR